MFRSFLLVLCGALIAESAGAAAVIVNEYNAVREDLFLQGTNEDLFLGRRLENGGDWFELVVIQDHLDMRDWSVRITNHTGGPAADPGDLLPEEEFILDFTASLAWADLRSGTIITISEDIPNNIGDYLPEVGKWWINVRADDNALGTYISATNFKTSNDRTQITVKNHLGQTIFGPAGEFQNPLSGVGNEEVFKLEADPSSSIIVGSCTPTCTPGYWNDGASSTYGLPNQWSGGTLEQDFSVLRGVVPYSPLADVVINEVNTHTDLPDEDWVELHNTSGSPIDISGWYLSDNKSLLQKYEIPASTTLPANGYLVFTETQMGFAFKSDLGDQVFLSEGDGFGMTGARTSVEFGAVENGVSFGRHPNGSGPLYRMQTRTPGAANGAPSVGPVVINELMYNPLGPAPGALILNELEYVELFNAGVVDADLWRDFGGEGVFGWALTGGIDFTFPVGTTIAARSYLLIVAFDPLLEPAKLTAFRGHYGLDPSVPIIGPYTGGLNDFSDRVRLRRPDNPSLGVAPMVIRDALTYFDFNEWPKRPDGNGSSLERIDPFEVADIPTNWASSKNGGTPGGTNSAFKLPALSLPGRLLAVLLLGAGSLLVVRARTTRRR
jgi:hypothetical protein